MQTKKRQRRKHARPGEIIEAALTVFASNGFEAARVEDIAERAGIAKGTVYRYFESKDALFEAVVKSRVSPLLGRIGAQMRAAPDSSREILRMMITQVHAQLVEGDLRDLMRIMIAEGARYPHLVAIYHKEMLTPARALLAAVIRHGVERGEFRESCATALPQVIMAPALLAAVWKMIFEPIEPVPAKKFLDAHLALVFEGLQSG